MSCTAIDADEGDEDDLEHLKRVDVNNITSMQEAHKL